MTRKEWLEKRKAFLTASDVAALFGLGFNSAFGVGLIKLGYMEDWEVTQKMAWGSKLEEVIAYAYAETTGNTILYPGDGPFTLVECPEAPWAAATPDRFALDGGDKINVECKNAETRMGWGRPGTDQVPDGYRIQVEWQMWCTGLKRTHIAVLFAGCTLDIYKVKADPRLRAVLAARGKRFWDDLKRGVLPPPDYRDPDTPQMLAALYGYSDSEVALGDDALELLRLYRRAKADEKVAAADAGMAKCKILEMMQGHSRAALPDGSSIKRRRVEVAEQLRRGYSFEGFYPRYAEDTTTDEAAAGVANDAVANQERNDDR